MATRNPAQQVDANTRLGAGQFLEYHLKPKGNGNFAWVDGSGNTVLAHTNFPPMLDEYVWQLKAAANNGSIVLTVPQNGSYSNTGNIGDTKSFGLSLGFFTAPGYKLTVSLCNSAGVVNNVETVTYTGGQPTDDPAIETVNTILG